MQTFIKALLPVITLFAACSEPQSNTSISVSDTIQKKTITDTAQQQELNDRLSITGDFNGDGITDTVRESYISSITNLESKKLFDSSSWDNNIEQIKNNKGVCRLIETFNKTNSFVVTDKPQQAGLLRLDNLGNINKQKGDELGYVIDWADYSGLNTYVILSFDEHKIWKEIYSFPINENISLEPEALYNGKDILIKISPYKIRYKYYNNEGEVKEKEKTF